jgi:hypothetical protein
MGRVPIHIATIVGLIALIAMLRQPASLMATSSPTPTPQTDQQAPTPRVLSSTEPSWMVKNQVVEGREDMATRVVTDERSEPAPSPTIQPRRKNPMPSGELEGQRPEPGLSIRGIRLGTTRSETEALYPGPEVVDRIKDYWGPGYRNETRRFGATWYRYSGFHASFDREGVCGAVKGDGLERGGVPILARGDSGADVERLLGRPNYCQLYYMGRMTTDDANWTYEFTDKSSLTVHFSDGVVYCFEWRDRNFSDSGC